MKEEVEWKGEGKEEKGGGDKMNKEGVGRGLQILSRSHFTLIEVEKNVGLGKEHI